MRHSDCWTLIHLDRARLANLLEDLVAAQWQPQTLCAVWALPQVLAPLSAAAKRFAVAWGEPQPLSDHAPATTPIRNGCAAL